jgi:AcrR family transcriptional regulator
MARPRTDIAPRILAAARDRFRQHGVDGASLRAIARDAGTSIGMIYYYFPTKDELFFAAFEEVYVTFLASLEQTLASASTVEDRLIHLYDRFATISDDELDLVRLIAHEAVTASPRFERLVERFLRGHVPPILRMLLDGVREGALDGRRHPIVLLLATISLAGPPQMIRRKVGARMPIPGVPSGKELARELVNVLLHGIAAKPS